MKKERNAILGVGLITVLLASCSQQPQSNLTVSGLDPQNFVADVKGKPTSLYTLKNSNGMEVCVTNFGGRIVSIMVPDKNDSLRDVVLGFDSIADYINKPSDFGAAIGRYANRINKGRIVIDGDSVQLPTNNFGHCLHGGPQGWQYQVYEGKQLNDTTLTMTMYSPDGDQNFPGAVTATVTYTLSGDNALDNQYDQPFLFQLIRRSVPTSYRSYFIYQCGQLYTCRQYIYDYGRNRYGKRNSNGFYYSESRRTGYRQI